MSSSTAQPTAGTQRAVLDDATFTRFHLKVTAYSTGGMFCDGYMLGIIAPALAVYQQTHEVSSLWTGLVGASALIGLFIGAWIFGWVTDRIGRQTAYIVDLAVFVICSLLHLAFEGIVWLFALRLLLGIAIGADYAIAPTLLAEFAPRRHRGWLLASINVLWTIGYVAAVVVGYLLSGLGPDAWQWMLASAAIPAALIALLRLGTPESPRWLARKGRREEALRVLREHIDPNATEADLEDENSQPRAGYMALLKGRTGLRTLYGGLFWFCQVVPYFAIFTFLPVVLAALEIEGNLTQTVVVNVFLLLGAVGGMIVVNRINRRPFVISSFLTLSVVMGLLGVWVGAPPVVVVALFAVFAFAVSAAQALAPVYPSEMFPTDLRASGVGIVTAISRIGAAIGTFLLPIGVDRLGVHATTLIAAGVLVTGLLASIAWAPETRHLALADAART